MVLDFNQNSKKQSGIVDQELLTFDDLKNNGERIELTTTFYQKQTNKYGLIPDIFDKELYLYAKTEKNSSFVPLDSECQLESIESTIHKSISVENKVFYTEYKLKYSRDGLKIVFGEMITVSRKNSTNMVIVNIQAPELLKDRIIGAQFLIAAFEAGYFKIHKDIAKLDVDTFDSDNLNIEMLTQQLKYYERIQKMLDELHVAEDLNMTTLTKADSHVINYLVDVFIDKRTITQDEFESPGKLKITIQNIQLLLLVSRNKESPTEYHIKDFLGKDIPLTQKLEDGRMQNVFPTFSILKKAEYAELSNINFDIMIDMYEQCKGNLDIYEIANSDALKMLSAYDECGKSILLDSAVKIFHWIFLTDDSNTVPIDIKQLDCFQCVYRTRILNENEKREVLAITESCSSSASIKFAGYTLLEQFLLAKYYFSKLTSEEATLISGYPIFKIYKGLEEQDKSL